MSPNQPALTKTCMSNVGLCIWWKLKVNLNQICHVLMYLVKQCPLSDIFPNPCGLGHFIIMKILLLLHCLVNISVLSGICFFSNWKWVQLILKESGITWLCWNTFIVRTDKRKTAGLESRWRGNHSATGQVKVEKISKVHVHTLLRALLSHKIDLFHGRHVDMS